MRLSANNGDYQACVFTRRLDGLADAALLLRTQAFDLAPVNDLLVRVVLTARPRIDHDHLANSMFLKMSQRFVQICEQDFPLRGGVGGG